MFRWRNFFILLSVILSGCIQSGHSSYPNLVRGETADSYWVVNPTSQARLYVRVIKPTGWDGESLPGLVLVPGGFGDSSTFTQLRATAQNLADHGYMVVVFDPDGRGKSEGEENKDGFVHQDGLAAIIWAVVQLPEIDAERMGLVSYSFGVTMATGTLARYSELPIDFLIDWEGPANREDATHGCSGEYAGIGSTSGMALCSNESFWAEREAETFVVQILVPYQRIQSQSDHSLEHNLHAIRMVNAAVEGNSPWVRLNNLMVNQTYDSRFVPKMLPDSIDTRVEDYIADYVIDLFGLP